MSVLEKRNEEIEEFCNSLELSNDVSKTAKLVYKKIYDNELYYGRQKEELIASSIYAACKIQEEPCNIKDILNVLDVKKNDIFKVYKYIVKNTDIQNNIIPTEVYITKLYQNLEIDEETIQKAQEIYKSFKENNKQKRCLKTYAASSVYLAVQDNNGNITQKQISEELDISTVSIRASKKEMKEDKKD